MSIFINKYKNLILFIIFIVIISYFLHKNKLNNTIYEGMTYNESEKEIKYIYEDYDNIQIAQLYDYGKCLLINNEIQLCEKKEHVYHDMITHFPIQYLQNNLKHVLIIGGGDLMTLREIMKYKTIENVVMLELNETIVDICKKYFDQDDYEEDSRVEIIYGDANITIDKLDSDYINRFDLIIVDTTEDSDSNSPVDTIEFFNKCINLLQPNGLLVKNGERFINLFKEIENTNVISYYTFISYFENSYPFSILSLENNDIKDIDIEKNNWNDYNIDCKFYKKEKHNKYLMYEH
tara:strand:- start:5059 stop:5934 length:876 start_codon:yes stop_codon:yes gene_type:complete